jgi:plasmid stabilization system protein ParE
MKKKNVVISFKARSSIKEISTYLKENVSTAVAKKVREAIIAKCKSLEDFSGYSAERYLEDQEENYQSVMQWEYNIIYKVSKNQVQVLNIIHCKQHPSKRENI